VPSAALRDPKFLQNKWPADITGHARLYKEKGGYFTPPNNLQRNEFYVLLREDLEKFTGHSLAPFYIVNDAPLFGSNYRADDRLDIPNNHLAYAATWYSLACVFLLMMIMSFRKNNGGVNYE
jgi:cytochrome oxidase assembly protein ShyY1